MNWRVKGLTQKVLSGLPGGARANDLLQRSLGGLRQFDRGVGGKVDDWAIIVDHLANAGVRLSGARCFEIGTGWFPTLPVCFHLAGAASCVTVDVCRHLSPRLTYRMLVALAVHLSALAAAGGRPLAEVKAAYDRLRATTDIADLLGAAEIEYLAPADAVATRLPPDSVDIVFSNSVLEHVSAGTIDGMMRESARLLTPGGVVVHSVNCGDHYAYFDRRITPINYLTYSEREWRFWNNRLQYQNRLRPSDFVALAERAGLTVVRELHRPRAELLATLSNLDITPEFRNYPPDQLCSTSVTFVARKGRP